MQKIEMSRRSFVAGALSVAALGLLPTSSLAKEKSEAEKVTANEDLMREHGVIRRGLLVYREAAVRLDAHKQVPLEALLDTARLFKTFAEDYHERAVEEKYVFPEVRKTGGKAADLVDVLYKQHERSREITAYLLKEIPRAKGGDQVPHIAQTLQAVDLMYEHHTVREDTVVFPAWKKDIGSKNYEEMGEKFEEIEHRILGNDGFDEALKKITRIEAAFGLEDLAKLTAPPPA